MEYKGYNLTRNFREIVLRSPKMFIGENWDADGLHYLIELIIKSAVAPESLNNCKQLQVILHVDDSISLIDNGRGLPIKVTQIDQSVKCPAIEHVLTWIIMNHPNHGYYKEFGFINYLGCVLNNVSQKLVLETVQDGITYQVSCSRGKIIEHLHKVTSSHKRGTMLTFTPDEDVFEGAKFNSNRLIKHLSELSKQYPDVQFCFKDKNTKTSVDFE